MANDRSQQEKKKIPKDHIKKIKPWVDVNQKCFKISGDSKKKLCAKAFINHTLKLLAEFYFATTYSTSIKCFKFSNLQSFPVSSGEGQQN